MSENEVPDWNEESLFVRVVAAVWAVQVCLTPAFFFACAVYEWGW